MEKIITFGEIMLRLTPPDYTKIDQAHSFVATYGGGEANVAVSLAYLGHQCYFLSKLPPTEVGDSAIQHLRGHNVNTKYVVRGSSTMGIYFYEAGFGGRPSKVIYNRRHSAFTRVSVDEFPMDEIFQDATWFHVSGITLALGKQVREVTLAALQHCRKYHVPVSFDFNYRAKLWTMEDARKAYLEVLPYVDYVFASYFDAHTILGIVPDATLKTSEDQQQNVLRKMIQHYQIKALFSTERTIYTATENALRASVLTDQAFYQTKDIRFQIHDRIGAGDAFASGVIHQLIKNPKDFQMAIDFGLVTSVLKHTIYGDVARLKEEDIQNYLQNAGQKSVDR